MYHAESRECHPSLAPPTNQRKEGRKKGVKEGGEGRASDGMKEGEGRKVTEGR